MKIAIPANEDKTLCPHFGHAPFFAVLELEGPGQGVKSLQLLQPEQGGHSAVPPWLNSLGVMALIAGGLGQLAIENLNRHGIEVHYGAPELPVEEIARLWLAGELKLNPRPCTHTHDHDCSHEGHTHG